MNEECLKLTTYFGERQRSGDRFLAEAMLDLFGERQIATSIMLRGIAGFGLRHHLRTDQFLSMSEDPPVAVIAVDTKTNIDQLLDPLLTIKKRGLVTLERARLVRDDIGTLELSEELHEATKLTIYVGRKERAYGMPAYIALCDLMYRRQLAGASVFLGVDGTAHGQTARVVWVVSHLKATCRPALPLEVTRRIAISPAGVLVSVSSSTTACATTLQDPLVSSHHQGGSDERQRRRTHVTPRHHGRTIVPHGCLNLDAHNVEWIFNFSQPGDIVDVRYAGSLPGSVGVVGHAGSAMAILTVDGEKGWNHLTCDETLLLGEFVNHIKGVGNILRRVDDDGDHRDVTAELKQLVAVRFVITVEAPDAAQHGRASRRLALPKCPDQRTVDGLAAVPRRLGGVDHQLLPQGQPMLVGAGQRVRSLQQFAVTLADSDPFDRDQRTPQQSAELGQHPADLLAAADGDNHHRHVGVAVEETGAFAVIMVVPVLLVWAQPIRLAHTAGEPASASRCRYRRYPAQALRTSS